MRSTEVPRKILKNLDWYTLHLILFFIHQMSWLIFLLCLYFIFISLLINTHFCSGFNEKWLIDYFQNCNAKINHQLKLTMEELVNKALPRLVWNHLNSGLKLSKKHLPRWIYMKRLAAIWNKQVVNLSH